MRVNASLNYLRISARKVRRVVPLVEGLAVPAAQAQLKFGTVRAAKPVLKLLESAVANAAEQFKLTPAELVVSQLLINDGPVLKRSMPRARGKVDPILKRTSHVKIILESVAKSKPKAKSVKSAIKPKALKKPAAT